ncbi:MAG: AAA family ATPase [Chloroflexi bacterium]|nr:AAA family ATPase [Chloroflexota bacterium]
MFKKLTLKNFKNFQKAELSLGPFTVLVGANATGKSNLREAFRFLHGIGRGYTLPEIIGEKWIEGGVPIWKGIRGGTHELAYFDNWKRVPSLKVSYLDNSLDFQHVISTGIHPSRLYLLTQLIESQTAKGNIQVVASTHSPLLLNYLSPQTQKFTSLLYRLDGEPDAHIQPVLDIPDAPRLIQEQGLMQLYESGWLEDAMFLNEDEPQELVAEAVS